MASASVSNLEFIVLGSGTSAGIPVIGCDCDVCSSDDPRDDRTRASVCVRFVDAGGQERLVLIDTSPDLRRQALRHGINRCDGILYTHSHVDHTFGLDEVRLLNIRMGRAIDVYAESETMDSLRRIYRHIFDKANNVNVSFVASLVPRQLDPAQPVDLHGLRFTPLRLLHGKLPILGYRLDVVDSRGKPLEEQPTPLPLAYCTDVSDIPPETWSRLTGLRTLILDMLRYKTHATHYSVDQAIKSAERAAADATWFTHMTHDIRHADLDPKLPQGMALAYDGLTLK